MTMALPQTRLLRCSGSIRTGGTRNATICLGTQRFRSCRPLPSTSASQSSVQAATMLHPAQLWRKITAPASDTLSVGSRTQDTPRRRHSEKQRFLRCCCVSGAMSAATGATTSEAIFVLGTLYCIPLIVLVAVAPFWRGAIRALRTDAIFVPLAAAYLVLLLQSWQHDTLSIMMPGSLARGFAGGRLAVQFVPNLDGIVQLFSRMPTAASLWVHLLFINLFAARWIMFDGLRQRIFTLHSVIIAGSFGPLGLCSHFLTQILTKWVGHSAASSRYPPKMQERP